jgi:hypothetical protein
VCHDDTSFLRRLADFGLPPNTHTTRESRAHRCWLQLLTYFDLNKLKAVTNMQVDRY